MSREIEKIIITPPAEDIQKHGYVPTPPPIVDISPPEKSDGDSNQSNSDSK